MGECARVSFGTGTAFIALGGPVYTIDGIRFEWSKRFGPAVVSKGGRILDRQPVVS